MPERFYSAVPAPVRTALFTLVIFLSCVSCGARLDGEFHSDGRTEFTLKSTLFPGASRLLKGLAANSGGGPVFDAALLNRNFAAISGIESSTLRNTGEDGIEGGIVVASITQFLTRAADTVASKGGGKKFSAIVWEQSATGGTLTININMDTGQELLLLISPDLVDYLSALMAPIATGEIIDRAAYLELVASVYGKSIADEIMRARISLKAGFPGPVESVSGGNRRGSYAEFMIPLTDLLVLDQPLRYEVRWTPWR
ncbi:MAG: hypothetical protein LBB47_04060 [Spirochaetaceae bacterium]|jgi:hypothetical protein|nr:hypothetical protein [Spirochaetaceae bacterium]